MQKLEFLDLGGLSEDEKFCLQSYLDGPSTPKTNLIGTKSTGEARHEQLGKGIQASEPCTSGAFQNAAVDHMAVPITVGFPPPAPVHVYQQNMCIATTLPQYPQISYPISMLSGAHHLMRPNFFMSPPNPAIPHPGPFSQPGHRALSQQQFPRKGKPPRAKFSPRKELPNGHANEGFTGVVFPPHGSYAGPFFPGNMVQAATGVPIVMQSVSSYAPPHSVHVTTASPPPIYPVATFTPITVSAAQSENVVVATPGPVLPSIETEEQPEKSQEQPISTVVETNQKEIKQELEMPVAIVSQPISAPLLEKEPTPTLESSSSGKSWASLFKKDSTCVTVPEKPTARVEPFTSGNDIAVLQTASASSTPTIDPCLHRLAQHLAKYELHQTPLALLPRGLINKGNWCYINATLQALVACSPFVHLMKSLVPFVRSKSTESTPIVESVLEFIEQFETVPIKSVKDRQAAKKEDPHIGISFEPSSIYKALSKIRSETFKVEGRQEDAEEFLSCLLNALHDEMIEIMKNNKNDLKPAELKHNAQEEDDWQVIGPKNRGCVTHTTAYSKTPISNLFLGQMRSALHYAGAQSTATLQPFFSLQLDIQNEKVNSVRDALACLVSKEPLTGYVCSKTGQEVEASRQITLEELPPILILHLKCFVYDKSGGIQKLMKRVDFTSDLELSKEFLSPSQKGKLKEGQRKYKLFAVVYHDGKEATKGHYITEVHHAGVGGWLRFDDSIVRLVDSQLFKYSPPRMPYLLLYRKLNL